MEQSKRNFWTYQILSGCRFFSINGKRYKLINPTKELRILAEHVYKDTVHDLRFDTLITPEKLERLLIGLGTWGPRDQTALEKLETHLEDKKVALFRALYDSEKVKTIRRIIKTAKHGIGKSYARKHSLDYMTLDYHGSLTKKRFLTAMCILDENNDRVYDETTYLSADSTILDHIVNVLDSNTITVEQFRDVARNDPWRTMWNIGKESCIPLPVSEWTDDQKILVTFAKMYDNAYQSMECPPDKVIEDDDMFDGWLLTQKRDRDKGKNTQHVDKMKGISDKAQEVFVFAPNREDADKIYDLNDEHGRIKIQQRERFIDQQGHVQAADLPDTKMELRIQAMREAKDKIKG